MRLKPFAVKLTLMICMALLFDSVAQAQTVSNPKKKTHTVSNFGISFVFSPTPICQNCLETELGLTQLGVNTGHITLQFQTRVTVNWGNLCH